MGAAAQAQLLKRPGGEMKVHLLELQNWVLSQSHPFFGETSRTWVETSGRFGLLFERRRSHLLQTGRRSH